jgi:hypothetical protein
MLVGWLEVVGLHMHVLCSISGLLTIFSNFLCIFYLFEYPFTKFSARPMRMVDEAPKNVPIA